MFALSRNHVHYWMRRYVALGVSRVLRDTPRPGRRKRITPDQVARIVNATLTTTPPGKTHCSTRTMARAQGVSEKTIRNIWHQHGLQPHRVTRFKLSKDPHFVDKLRDVVGLYLNPPEKAVVFCVDEKSGIQALDRTRPVLPLRPRIPERQTHDYIRHGTTCLYAALRLLDGVVLGVRRPKRDTKEFVRFLDSVEHATAADHSGATRDVDADATFIFIGSAPRTEMVAGLVERDAQGFILTGRDLLVDGRWAKTWTANRDPFLFETSVPGVFAAGAMPVTVRGSAWRRRSVRAPRRSA